MFSGESVPVKIIILDFISSEVNVLGGRKPNYQCSSKKQEYEFSEAHESKIFYARVKINTNGRNFKRCEICVVTNSRPTAAGINL